MSCKPQVASRKLLSGFHLLSFIFYLSSCAQKPAAPTFGELSRDSIGTDTTMQHNFETSYEFQKELMDSDTRYEVKSTAFFNGSKEVKHFVLVEVTNGGADTFYNQAEPSSVFKVQMSAEHHELLTLWKDEKGDTQRTVFPLIAKAKNKKF